jgi:hypothetical protein
LPVLRGKTIQGFVHREQAVVILGRSR